MKIAISAESTIDLPKELLAKYDIHTLPFTLVMGEKQGLDGEIKPEDLYEYTEKTGTLPHTAAVNEYQYSEHFTSLLKEYDHIIHFCLSSEISCACLNARNAATKLDNKVDVIDTRSLSTGIALQAIYASLLAKNNHTPEEIVNLIKERIPFDQTSFSLESVNYLYKGGRCSYLKMLGANILKIKPAIYVNDGKMGIGGKYRGNMLKAVMGYVEDTLAKYNNPDHSRVFITYSTAPEEVVAAVRERLEKEGFKEIIPTTAGATISCHCGPHCLGILYFNDGDGHIE